jgi:hypothetical protein
MRRHSTTVLIIIGIAAALAMVGIVTITVVVIPQEAEAGCERGAGANRALESSGGKCFDRGTF